MAIALIRPDQLYGWKGPSLLIVNTRGECGDDLDLSGFYHREARFLRTLRFEIDEDRLWLCEAAALAADSLTFTYVYPEITATSGGGSGQADDQEHTNSKGVPERALDIQVSTLVDSHQLTVSLVITNRALRRVEIDLAAVASADFADILEVQGERRQTAAIDVAPAGDRVTFFYRHPELKFRMELHHDSGWQWSGDRLRRPVSLEPRQRMSATLRVVPFTNETAISAEAAQERTAVLRKWIGGFARIEVPGNRAIERIIASNIRDVASLPLLDGAPDEWLAFQAGMPLYPAFFGRDAVTVGWQMGCVDAGEALEAAMTKLGRLQSGRVDDWRDEEPGRLPYQIRRGPQALLNLNPYTAYYADYATPLMFVISLANLYAWTGDRKRLEKHWDTARRVLEWAETYGDMDGDGYLEYRTRSSAGTKNQGWKDSGDAIIYDDGRAVPAPIATCELQGYWYAAQQLMGLLAWVLDLKYDAAEHARNAAALKQRFNRDWWMADEQFFALALDPQKRQVRAVTSNVGHCLASGIIDRDLLPPTVGRMFAPDLFSGWGIRTLSSNHAYYDPLSYHRGTVWAVEQATTLFGLRRFGFDARALDLAEALFTLAELYPEHRIPECIGGYARGDRATPGAYPRANAPQLWNASAFALTVQTLLGLVPLALAETLVVDPALPSWLSELVLHDLRVGEARVTLRFWRDGAGDSKWDVLHKTGSLRVIRQPPPESMSAGWLDRITGVMESI